MNGDPEMFLLSDVHPSKNLVGEIPQKIQICSQGLSEAELDAAHAEWVAAWNSSPTTIQN